MATEDDKGPRGERPDRGDSRRSEGRPPRDGASRPSRDGRPPRSDRPQRDGARPPYGDRPRRDAPRADGAGRAGSGRPTGAAGRPDREGGRPARDGRPSSSGRPQGTGRPSGAGRAQGDGRPAREGGFSRDSRPPRTDRPQGDRGARPPRSDDRGGRPTGGAGYRGAGSGRPPANDRASRPPERFRESGPELPEDITARDLHAQARNELKTLSKENAEEVARHLAMAARLIEEDPALAHEHALAATRRAGRIAVVRETAAITAYGIGDFALALRELRTYRRISGRDDQIALIVDSERGVGRPDRGLEEGRSVDRSLLPTEVRVELAIAMSGARLDLGDTERALQELDIPELDPDRAFEWSPALFAARAAVLEELGREDEAALWQRRADVAADALEDASGAANLEVLIVDETEDPDVVIPIEDEPEPVSAVEPDVEQEPAPDASPAGDADPAPDTADVDPAPDADDADAAPVADQQDAAVAADEDEAR